ncbi:Hypothetical predicted protein [Scomber scombrus]|uniref:Uncharacterized protein n=1 Tax=Scomber scombrus TaxID=13677 RepID=A0AAV1MZ51_SCOSC
MHAHVRAHLAVVSALATETRGSPIGLRSARCCPLFASLTATQEGNCLNTAADTGVTGLGRVWPECAVDADREKDIAVCIRYGYPTDMQLAHIYGCMRYYQSSAA